LLATAAAGAGPAGEVTAAGDGLAAGDAPGDAAGEAAGEAAGDPAGTAVGGTCVATAAAGFGASVGLAGAAAGALWQAASSAALEVAAARLRKRRRVSRATAALTVSGGDVKDLSMAYLLPDRSWTTDNLASTEDGSRHRPFVPPVRPTWPSGTPTLVGPRHSPPASRRCQVS